MILWIILALLVILIAAVLIRTANFKPGCKSEVKPEPVEFDRQKAVDNLQQLVRCRTVSNRDPGLEDDAEFEKLIGLLPELYPAFWNKCPLTRFPDRGLLFKWEGQSHERCSVMMAHYDVVPADEELWIKPPFEAIIEDGILWGRGTLDTKNSFNGALTAADHLIAKGFVPEYDVYFAFSGGEEVNGRGAENIVDWFEAQGISPELVLDEGGAVVKGVFPGVDKPCAVIGVAEKGMMNVDLKVNSDGGHASSPLPGSPLVRLSKACLKLESNPFPFRMTKPVAAMFDTLGRESTFLYRMIFANMWLFSGLLGLYFKKTGGILNALVRTTVAFTQAEGSSANNVIPPEAHMGMNLRVIPGETIEDACEYIRKTINDENISISVTPDSMNPSRVSVTDCEGWNKLAESVAEAWDGCLVSPYLMIQCSDSHSYGRISDKVYRFSAADMTDPERETIHGNDEHIRLETIEHAVEFYIRLLSKC